jgi:hypothetical protein
VTTDDEAVARIAATLGAEIEPETSPIRELVEWWWAQKYAEEKP